MMGNKMVFEKEQITYDQSRRVVLPTGGQETTLVVEITNSQIVQSLIMVGSRARINISLIAESDKATCLGGWDVVSDVRFGIEMGVLVDYREVDLECWLSGIGPSFTLSAWLIARPGDEVAWTATG